MVPFSALDSTVSLVALKPTVPNLGTDLEEECLGCRCTLLHSFLMLLPELEGGDLPLASAYLEALCFFLDTGKGE